MSNKSQLRAEIRRRRARQKMIQTIVVGVIAFAVVAFIIWNVLSQRNKNASQANQQACTPATLQYSELPPMTIDPAKQYFATVKLVKGGEFVIQLFPDKAPATVNSFVFLAKQGYFHCVTFHRVLENFMAQGGDPTGTGMGGPGYNLPDEITDLTFDKAGVVAMANSGVPNSGGSQFFITFGPQEYLNGGYTIFGQVTSGMEVVNSITLRDPDTSPNYAGDAIESITISEQ
jgi:peptidylprolyl isomerase